MSIERLSMITENGAWCSWRFLVVSSMIHGVVVFKYVLGMVSWIKNEKKNWIKEGFLENPKP